MHLSTEHFAIAKSGEPVLISAEGTEFVILRADVYDRVKMLLHGEAFDPEEAYPAVEEALGEDPNLESYQVYKRRP